MSDLRGALVNEGFALAVAIAGEASEGSIGIARGNLRIREISEYIFDEFGADALKDGLRASSLKLTEVPALVGRVINTIFDVRFIATQAGQAGEKTACASLLREALRGCDTSLALLTRVDVMCAI